MEWIQQYQLFLFDFDGLLVNTEELHYAAYQRMCARRGFQLNWKWETYALAAHYTSTGLKEKIYQEFPKLFEQEPKWEVLYAEKKRAYLELLEEGRVQLMPGVAELITALDHAKIKCSVVTHSPSEQIKLLRSQLPLLNLIPHWITREHYQQAKPHPECYQKAIELLANPQDRIIGFEDSPRGLQALLGTEATAVLVSTAFDQKQVIELSSQLGKAFLHYPSFQEIKTQAIVD